MADHLSKKRKRRERIATGNIRRYSYKFTNTKGISYLVFFYKPHEKHFGGADGLCYDPDEDTPRILINPYLTQKTELNTIIHEFCHAFFWDATEKEVYKFANTVTGFLYRQGWRRDDDKRNDSPPKERKNKKCKRRKKI